MASDQLRIEHPRRAGIGDALARIYRLETEPVDRKLLHRIDLKEAARK